MSETTRCAYCDGAGEVEMDNNGPIGPCPICQPRPLRDMLRSQEQAMRRRAPFRPYVGRLRREEGA